MEVHDATATTVPAIPTVHADGTPLPGQPTLTPGPNVYGQLGNIQYYKDFYDDAMSGTLPAVSWIAPDIAQSDHAPYPLSIWAWPANGQYLLWWIIHTLAHGPWPQWQHTAVFVAWDDWGGFYDHVVPPTLGSGATADQNGYGIRVPGMVIGPYAQHCSVDHQQLSFDAYNRFIEDDFLGSQRLDPATDGRPDPRGTAQPVPRETAVGGDLSADFAFTRTVFTDTSIAPLAVPTPGATYPIPDAGWCTS